MPAVVRFGDMGSGHGCYPPRNNDQGSPNVFVNSLGAHRVGDHWVTHCCGIPCHDSVQASGSSTVFVNSKALARIGDSIACGSTNATGSPDVFAGG